MLWHVIGHVQSWLKATADDQRRSLTVAANGVIRQTSSPNRSTTDAITLCGLSGKSVVGSGHPKEVPRADAVDPPPADGGERADHRPPGPGPHRVRRRQDRRMGGRRWDTVSMDCLAPAFTSPVLGRIFSPDVPRDRRGE